MKRTIQSYFVKQNVSPGPSQTTSSATDEEPCHFETSELMSDEEERQPVAQPVKKRTYAFQLQWLKDFRWLRYKDNAMYCVYCRECGPSFAGCSKLATESTHFKRESLNLHGDSIKHKICRDRCISRSTDPLPTAFQRQDAGNRSSEEAEMVIKFNTAYNIAKEELPFSTFKSQIVLMKKNGLGVNPTYANDVSCAQFIGVIADTLKEKTGDKVASAPYLSFMIDGDTDVSSKECEIVYARIIEKGRPSNILIGHVEVEHAHAKGVYAATKAVFIGLGPKCVDWLDKTVAMGADGAAVNLGQKGGVIALLQAEVGPFIVPFHCMPHRLELGLLSVQREIPMIGQVYDLLNLVWKTYHFSPKSMRELKTLGAEIGVTVNAPSGVKGTRWLPHVSRSLNTFLKPGKDHSPQSPGQFTAVHMHMDHLAGASANADIAGRAKKIKNTMEDGTFVAFCHFLADLFTSISRFSLLLQRNDVILPQAVNGINHLLATIEAMAVRPKPGGKFTEFQAAMEEQHKPMEGEDERQKFKYQEVTLSKGEAAKLAGGKPISQCAPRLQKAIVLTCESTVKHLKTRFGSLLEENTKEKPTAKAVRCFSVFNHDSWPEHKQELLNHGEEEVDFLLEHFSTVLSRNGCSKDLAKEEFQAMKMMIYTSFKDKSYIGLWEIMLTKEPYCSEYENILHLVHIMLVLPISSAVCERGFSTQKRIKSDLRSRLNPDTVEDLIRISVEGPELAEFDAKESVQHWFSQGERTRRPNYKSWTN